jgi:hypothetical protein
VDRVSHASRHTRHEYAVRLWTRHATKDPAARAQGA